MLKLKNQNIVPCKNVSLGLFSARSAASTMVQHYIDQEPISNQTSTSYISRIFDTRFYISTLIKCKNVSQIKQSHAQIAVTGLLDNLDVANKLLYVYTIHKALQDAYVLFDGLSERNAVSWSLIIGGFAKSSEFSTCFRIFGEYIRSGSLLDNYTLPFVIRACKDTKDLKMGALIHSVVCKFGLQTDSFVAACLADMYAKCNVIDEAKRVFDRMPKRDLITWTVMIGAYTECGNPKEALALFDQMRGEGVTPDKIAMVNIVKACAKLGAMHKAKLVHDYVLRMKVSLDVKLGTAIIDMYAKCGSVDTAREIFDSMREKNVISWSAMIAAYGYHGQGRKALDLFQLMLRSGISPNKITFVSLLYACSHAGLVEEARRLFGSMHEEFGVKPDVKHFTCMVDLFGRAGRFDEAMNLIENMSPEKDEGLWGALLGACRIHGKIELAEKAAKNLIETQPQNPGHYVVLSNIYGRAGKWDDVAKIRGLLTHQRLKKIPGRTWIEVGDKVHQFNVGDYTHPQSEQIYEELKRLSMKLEQVGYVPDTNFVLHDVDEELKLENLLGHSEKLAISFGLISSPEGTTIRITKNLRMCGDCHAFSKCVALVTNREIIARDANRFHHFKEGACSCGEYW